MVSNQLLKKTIDEFKSMVNTDIAIFDSEGKATATTADVGDIPMSVVDKFMASDVESGKTEGLRLYKIKDENRVEYILSVKDLSSVGDAVGKMAKYHLEALIAAHKERFDRDNFIKSLLLDNLLLVDIFDRARKLHIDIEARRIAFIIQLEKKNQNDAIGSVRSIFSGNEDFTAALDRKNIVVVRHVADDESYDKMESIAEGIYTLLLKDIGEEVKISFGTIVNDLKEVSKSYREAKMAMDVGKVFFDGRKINPYNKFGIGRLIYQLPLPLCRLFIKEVFGDRNMGSFDEETLTTINKFFENSLNVSETSRQLYIHRNTLVYRLDKIQKMTGLDLRIFEDAITFKIALMVSRYIQYVEGLE